MPPVTIFDFLLQLLPYIFTTGGIVAMVVSWRTRKSQIKQAESNAKETEATALQNIDTAYEKMSNQMNKEFDKMQKKITQLETKLENVLNQCSLCPTNKFKK